jgi:DNA polymerase-1
LAAKKCILVDGNSLLYRAFFAIRYLSTRDGLPTNALYGFAAMLLRLLAEEQPDCVIVAFDAPEKTFRHEEYADYKATRAPTPDELKQQAPLARDLARALGCQVLEAPGYEADDIVGTCARLAERQGYDVLVVTGDLDELQLVSDRVKVAVTGRGVSDITVYDRQAVQERFGLSPEQFVDYKALKGDPTDNIPGVPGVGDKTASRLVARFGGLDVLLEKLDEVEPEKLREALRASREQLKASRGLCRIVTDVPVQVDFEAADPSRRPPGEAEELFRRLEFESLIGRLPPSGDGAGSPREQERGGLPEVRWIAGEEELREAIESVRRSPGAAFVLEEAGAAGASLSFGLEGQALAVRLNGPGGQGGLGIGPGDGFRTSPDCLRPIVEDPAAAPATFDLKRVCTVMAGCGVEVRAKADDVMLAGFLLQPGRGSYSLEWLAGRYLGWPDTIAGGMSGFVARELARELGERLKAEELESVYRDIELPLAPVLAAMERRGVLVDRERLEELSERMAAELAALENAVYEIAGLRFNIGSTKQLAEILFEKLGLPSGRRTKTGYSTDAETLEALAVDHEIARLVLQWRELSKLKGTYSDALPRLVRPDTGRIHTSYNQTGAATGRLSSSDPNLQNIPIRTDIGREIRAAFVAPPGRALVSADYSQIELRLLAHLSGDEELTRCFVEGEDIHTRTACALFGVSERDVDPEMRRRGKTINFSVLYGKTDFGLARELGVSQAEARQYIDAYFRRYPRVRELNERILAEARETGRVRTMFGRKRWIPELGARDRNVRMNAERAAFNAPLQGSAADIIKLAMIRLEALLGGSSSQMILQVHDELVFEVPEGEVEAVASLARREMEGVCRLSVPLVVDVKAGPNWRDMSPCSAG